MEIEIEEAFWDWYSQCGMTCVIKLQFLIKKLQSAEDLLLMLDVENTSPSIGPLCKYFDSFRFYMVSGDWGLTLLACKYCWSAGGEEGETGINFTYTSNVQEKKHLLPVPRMTHFSLKVCMLTNSDVNCSTYRISQSLEKRPGNRKFSWQRS